MCLSRLCAFALKSNRSIAKLFSLLFLFSILSVRAAERAFDFSQYPINQTPTGFVSKVTGNGAPASWKIVWDDVPPLFRSITGRSEGANKRPVLAQLSEDATDERFPLLVFNEETFDDFTFTTRFKTVKGVAEQMAGVAFRIQDEKNYYVIRASSLGNTFRFYKFVQGIRSAPIGPDLPIPDNTWHELSVQCLGNQIRCFLNGKEVMPPLTDTSFIKGKVGFWTKSDSVTYFTDARINFTPREPLAEKMIKDTMQNHPRLLGIKIFAARTNENTVKVIASSLKTDLGSPADKAGEGSARKGGIFYAKGKESVQVTMPLHDRNGDVIAAARVIMRTFIGQTEDNALARARPIVQEMQARFQSQRELFE